jgi:hypothetical protein
VIIARRLAIGRDQREEPGQLPSTAQEGQ